jgi:c(7)-type cytochrome triheme protein
MRAADHGREHANRASGLGILPITVAMLCVLTARAEEPGDIRFVRQAAGMDDVAPAVFPHWVHRMAYTCYACHDSLFKMKAGEDLITMDQIQSGQSCGACHDGKTAFISNLSTCNRCHRQ